MIIKNMESMLSIIQQKRQSYLVTLPKYDPYLECVEISGSLDGIHLNLVQNYRNSFSDVLSISGSLDRIHLDKKPDDVIHTPKKESEAVEISGSLDRLRLDKLKQYQAEEKNTDLLLITGSLDKIDIHNGFVRVEVKTNGTEATVLEIGASLDRIDLEKKQ